MVVVGSSIGTESKECGRDTDSCYNVTADVNSFSVLQKAGCNTLLCQFNENQCTQKHISGIPVTFCCCKDADFCNNNSTVVSRFSAAIVRKRRLNFRKTTVRLLTKALQF
ncbi:unnamed protein product [Nippostrongylus brasiliensis]|uniref:Activin_recp domain-containing protein n=1 Tax=Nippostrongylus brasiliensis TaxID=27835 RepID=A0A0N4Y8Q4_NIPBR|nr:unnamed protein product [Nippostrongylus brasiliensis]